MQPLQPWLVKNREYHNPPNKKYTNEAVSTAKKLILRMNVLLLLLVQKFFLISRKKALRFIF